MGFAVASVLIALLIQCGYSESTKLPEPGTCGVDPSDRIHGGNITAPTSYPWTVILVFRQRNYNKDLFHCGGSLISDKYVLTAAHCVDGLSKRYYVDRIRVGEWDLLSNDDCDSHGICNDPPKDIGVAKITMHEDFDKSTLINDIALIKLNETVAFTETVSPLCLPIAEPVKTKDTDSMTFTAVGWGNTEHRNETYEYGSRYKLHVRLHGVNQTYCDNVYDEDILETQLCAGAEKGKDTCQGDSGGSLIAPVDGIHYAYGVVSYGYGCARKGVPGVYTRVTSFLDWIDTNMLE